MSEMDTSAEMMEVAEPSEELGEEAQEVAAPESEEPEDTESVEEEVEGKKDSDTAFAEMRRARLDAEAEVESLRREIAEMQAQNELFSELAGSEDWQISALADLSGDSEELVRLKLENEQLKAGNAKRDELANLREAELAMQEDLAKIQAIDPSVKSLEDLGEGFGSYIGAGLSAEDAYWAVKAKENASKPKPPSVVAGAVKTAPAEKEYYTQAEINAMSSEEKTKNWKKILASFGRN